MNRRRADAVVGLIVGTVLLTGSVLSWQAYQQQRALDGMMGSSMGAVHGTNPLWYVLGAVVVSVFVGGGYLVVRDDLSVLGPSTLSHPDTAEKVSGESDEPSVDNSPPNDEINPPLHSRTRVLDLLPEDERRVLDPVIDSPGITQIELRDRSDFSKSKVSQTVSALEKRGLLYRERQGRTYRIYPSDELETR
ncbi:helix-turn-helix transcriptional regulator [Halosimplex aquaticum]|uniref:Helix-turn-helix transcriptional regulator n=1 Tax=Halosimplex aquaticum TaxID=3026162 RepID=A0ABD5XZ96_9EURY|nr:MarR family transcriptional regulator [Halosimplex aquaticum]